VTDPQVPAEADRHEEDDEGDPEALALVAATLDPLIPPLAARDRLMAALAGPDRFRPFFADLARRCDLGLEALRKVLALVDDPAAWQASPLPGVALIHFTAGPAVAGADTGLVRVPAGATFPRHRHLGPEVAVVLEGLVLDTGRRYRPGEVVAWDQGTVHDYQAGGQRDLVVIVAHHGIEVLAG
jgi:quercetin dioxygenase-like cupin family protein